MQDKCSYRAYNSLSRYTVARVPKRNFTRTDLWDRPELSPGTAIRASEFQELIVDAIDRVEHEQDAVRFDCLRAKS
jgi:uncharacterized protein (DUF2384 family)